MIAIRTRILAPTIALVILGSLTLALLALRDSHREIEGIYDAQLVQAARLLQGILQNQDPALVDWGQFADALDVALNRSGAGILTHPYEINLAFQVWASDGRLLVRSEDAPALAQSPEPGIGDFLHAGRQWCGVLVENESQGLRIWVGEREDVRQDLIQRIVRTTLLPTLIGLPLLALIIWLLLGWGLKPLQRLARQLRVRPVESLEPLAVGPLPPELEPMRAALDHLLTHLRALLERERRFIADASHELRTPLAILDIHVRNARQAANAEEREEALVFLQHGVARAARIASQLLTMARLEPLGHEQCLLDLTAIAREELAELTPLALRRQVELVLDSEADCTLRGDPGSLAIMIQNLISNALAFAPPGSEVRVQLQRSSEGRLVMQVLDEGPGVSEAVLERLCDRFFSDSNPDGAGLGLAIVEMVSQRLGGALHLANRRQGGFCAQVSFPPLAQAAGATRR